MKSFLGILLFVPLLVGCGGGGGGSDRIPFAAFVNLQVSPENIDTGNRMLVRVDIQEVHPDGVIIKVRYPRGLDYFRGTSLLRAGGKVIDVDPTVNSRSRVTDEELDYLVFFFPRSLFDLNGLGTLLFELSAISAVETGLIEIDADINNRQVDDDNEFDLKNPDFSPDDTVDITVTD